MSDEKLDHDKLVNQMVGMSDETLDHDEFVKRVQTLEMQNVVSKLSGKRKEQPLKSDDDSPKDVDNREMMEEDYKDFDDKYLNKTRKLRRLLKLYFYSTFKLENNSCSFHSIKTVLFLIQVIKVALITTQMINIGNQRIYFREMVSNGHITLRHLLLENWDASWETLAYPPSKGEFAVYTIDDLESAINYAVRKFHNAEEETAGSFVRTKQDFMKLHVKYFIYPGSNSRNVTDDNLHIDDKSYPVQDGLSEENGVFYYNITKELEAHQMKYPIKGMLSITLSFSLHSVLVHARENRASCLRTEGWVSFKDLDHNGKINVNLETKTNRVICKDLNLSLTDWVQKDSAEGLGGTLVAFCLLSIVSVGASVTLAGYLFWQYYKRKNEEKLPASEYRKFVKLWDLVVFISDVLTVHGTVSILFENKQNEWQLENTDSYIVWLGVGCFLSWISMIRFFNFHSLFTLLAVTFCRAFWNVLALLICVIFLFLGFWICGFVVLGPYHLKFRTLGTAAETLLSIATGDDIYSTLAILDTDKTGSVWVWWFLRFYLGSYVFVFFVIIINMLIAIYVSVFESTRLCVEENPAPRDIGPIGKALLSYLMEQKSETALRESIHDLLTGDRAFTSAETCLRNELKKLLHVSESKGCVELLKPNTLEALITDEDDQLYTISCGRFKLSVICFFGKN